MADSAPRPRSAMLPVLLLLALVGGCSADGHLAGEGGQESDMMREDGAYPPAPGCGWPMDASPCPVWTEDGYMHPDDMSRKYDISQQDVPCTAKPATCEFSGGYTCSVGSMMMASNMVTDKFYQLKPGSPAVCGHGNREFSFLVKKRSMDKVLLIFGAGGICWDAATCGDPMRRTMAADSMGDAGELAPAVPMMFSRQALPTTGTLSTSGIFEGNSATNPFYDWSIVLIPDCTGDMSLGNRSYTYDAGRTSCITAHHMGAANAGLAIHWMMENFPSVAHLLIVGTGGTQSTASKADGASGSLFWMPYLKDKMPMTNIRVALDSSMGVLGPNFYMAMQDDPWGTLASQPPMADEDYPFLMPDMDDFFVGFDDQTYAMELAADHIPTVAFMEFSTTEDMIQKTTFEATGGMMMDCCLDGCNTEACMDVPLSREERGGLLDWTKSRRVAMVRRSMRLPKHYRSWLTTGMGHYLLTNGETYGSCPDGGTCDSTKVLKQALWDFATSTSTVNQEGEVITTLRDVDNGLLPPVYYTCMGCLDGIILESGNEFCNATMGPGENLFTVSQKYGTDWMALWSLNGDDTPEVRSQSTKYRFAHEYHVRAGESMEMIAQRFGVTVDDVVHLNFNQFTHIQNPARVKEGDVICVVPVFSRTMDQMGNPICPSDAQRFGEATETAMDDTPAESTGSGATEQDGMQGMDGMEQEGTPN